MTREEFAAEYLRDFNVKIVGDRLFVLGNLDLSGVRVKALPENLSVLGFMDLRGTGVQILPNGLEVSADLYLWVTNINTLPDDIQVEGYIASPNKFYASEELQSRLVVQHQRAIDWFIEVSDRIKTLHELTWNL